MVIDLLSFSIYCHWSNVLSFKILIILFCSSILLSLKLLEIVVDMPVI